MENLQYLVIEFGKVCEKNWKLKVKCYKKIKRRCTTKMAVHVRGGTIVVNSETLDYVVKCQFWGCMFCNGFPGGETSHGERQHRYRVAVKAEWRERKAKKYV